MFSFHVKFVQTDRRTDGRTTVKQYAPDLSMRGHKKGENAHQTHTITWQRFRGYCFFCF